MRVKKSSYLYPRAFDPVGLRSYLVSFSFHNGYLGSVDIKNRRSHDWSEACLFYLKTLLQFACLFDAMKSEVEMVIRFSTLKQ